MGSFRDKLRAVVRSRPVMVLVVVGFVLVRVVAPMVEDQRTNERIRNEITVVGSIGSALHEIRELHKLVAIEAGTTAGRDAEQFLLARDRGLRAAARAEVLRTAAEGVAPADAAADRMLGAVERALIETYVMQAKRLSGAAGDPADPPWVDATRALSDLEGWLATKLPDAS